MRKSIKYKVLSIKEWTEKNKTEFWILVFILLMGAIFRLYNISGYMTFLGDEGRDAIIVRRLLVDGDLILVGPGTSIGNMYLGPLYYYMMAPFLLLFNLSPVGPAVMVALLGIVTIWFVWFVVREWFPATPKGLGVCSKLNIGAFVAAFLYAIAPTVIIYSRSSWNPNIMPFFSLLAVYSIWKVWSASVKTSARQGLEINYKWLVVTGVSTAFVLQSHYLALLLVPVVGVFWFLTLIREMRSSRGVKEKKYGTWNLKFGIFQKYSLYGLGIFLGLMSPLFIFDAKHGWRNYEAMKVFFTERQTTVSAKPWTAIPSVWPDFIQVVTRVLAGQAEQVGLYLAAAILFLVAFVYIFRCGILSKINKKALLILAIWIGTALVGFGVYKQHIYDHYFGFIFPALFILVGGIFEIVYKNANKGGRVILVAGLAFLILVNFQNNPLRFSPNNQLARSVEVGEKIIEEAGSESFNLAVIAEQNYEGAYQYHLERKNASIVMIDAQRPETVTEQLFVVCEYEDKDKCDPTHNPKTEVANFGWSAIDGEWEIAGTTIFRLVHY